MPKLYIRTIAYNASATLERAVDSVLNQTYGDFVYYLCENGSTDNGKTRRIVDTYAQRDKRIVPFYNKVNRQWEDPELLELPHRINDDDYYCILDADDEYATTFFEKALAFMEQENLDIVACGCTFVDAVTGKKLGENKLTSNMILQGEDFSRLFNAYYWYARQTWNKIYKGYTQRNTIQRSETQPNFPSYGADTYNCLIAFGAAKRVGILAESLYKYSFSQKSVSHQLDPKRIVSDRILYDVAHDFLLSKVGYVSDHNEDFLLAVYMGAIHDTLKVLLSADIPVAEKLSGVIEIFTHEYTKRLGAKTNLGIYCQDIASLTKRRNAIFAGIADLLLKFGEVPVELAEGYCDALEFICAAIENADGWLFAKRLRVQFLTEQGRDDEAKPYIAELAELGIE